MAPRPPSLAEMTDIDTQFIFVRNSYEGFLKIYYLYIHDIHETTFNHISIYFLVNTALEAVEM